MVTKQEEIRERRDNYGNLSRDGKLPFILKDKG